VTKKDLVALGCATHPQPEGGRADRIYSGPPGLRRRGSHAILLDLRIHPPLHLLEFLGEHLREHYRFLRNLARQIDGLLLLARFDCRALLYRVQGLDGASVDFVFFGLPGVLPDPTTRTSGRRCRTASSWRSRQPPAPRSPAEPGPNGPAR
jgi:hypothetical protein